MVDYDKSTGASGTMRLRDTGSVVEFWLKSGFGSTFFGSANFSYTSPNGNGSFSHGYNSGDTWQKMGEKNVTDSGTVSWTMPATGTSSLGGPTTQSVSISREEKPGNPSSLSEEGISYTLATLKWVNGGALNGGDFIRYQIQVSSTPQSGSDNFSGTVEITANSTSKSFKAEDLKPGVIYDWHVRQLTSWGYSNWSGIASFQTLHGAWLKNGGAWVKAVPYVKDDGKWKIAIPYIKVGSNPGAWEVPDRA